MTLEDLITCLKAGTPGLHLVTPEDSRAFSLLQRATAVTGHTLAIYSLSAKQLELRTDPASVHNIDAEAPHQVLRLVEDELVTRERLVVVFPDIHTNWSKNQIAWPLVTAVKDLLTIAAAHQHTIVLVGNRDNLPPELRSLFEVTHLGLPDADQYNQHLEAVCRNTSGGDSEILQRLLPNEAELAAILHAARGMTAEQLESSVARSIARTPKGSDRLIRHEDIYADKVRGLNTDGLVEILEPRYNPEDVGGYSVFKHWLQRKKAALSPEARAVGLDRPRGALVFGPPGSGKSLVCEMAASALGLPLVRLSFGSLFGGVVGETESNTRRAIEILEALAPCVVWCEEMEKATAGMTAGGRSDGGVGSRMLQSFLTWMQENRAGVFFMCTANDVQQVPPEMLRPGRLDNLFYAGFPGVEARREIWQVVASQFRRQEDVAKAGVLDRLVEASVNRTGSEIRTAFAAALEQTFLSRDSDRPFTVSSEEILTQLKATPSVYAYDNQRCKMLADWAKDMALNVDDVQEPVVARKSGRKVSLN